MAVRARLGRAPESGSRAVQKERMTRRTDRMKGNCLPDAGDQMRSEGLEIHPSSFILHPSPPRTRIEVVAAVIYDRQQRFLLAQRPPGKVYAGYWEFPGGKVEPGESPVHALKRELREELGIEVLTAYPWLTRDFDYEHAAVRLRFHRVTHWAGELHGRELQEFAWQRIDGISVAPVLPANGPILRALALPAVYGITCAHALGADTQLQRIARALSNGLRLIQVREKQFTPSELRDYAARIVE